MATYKPTRTAWLAVNTVGQGQARLGRVLWAASGAPADDDWIVLPEGAVIPVTAAGYVRSVDEGAVFSVVAV